MIQKIFNTIQPISLGNKKTKKPETEEKMYYFHKEYLQEVYSKHYT